MHFAARSNGTRLSIIERLGNTRPNWPMKAGNSQADWLGIGVTLNTQKCHIADGSNYGVTVNRDECLSLEWFRSRVEAKVLIESWRKHYNEVRPHSSLGYLTPKEFINNGAVLQ